MVYCCESEVGAVEGQQGDKVMIELHIENKEGFLGYGSANLLVETCQGSCFA
jgi:hypothetical protein